MGPSHDQEIAWGSLTDFIEAAEALGIGPSDDLDLQQARYLGPPRPATSRPRWSFAGVARGLLGI